jgi:AraC-like DNA-binding protein
MQYFILSSINQVHADNCGNAILAPGWTHPERLLPSSVLILGQKGLVQIEVEKNILTIEPGSIAILPAGHIHKGICPISIHSSYFWMHFTVPSYPLLISSTEFEKILKTIKNSNFISNGAIVPINFSLVDSEPFFQSFHNLLYEQECRSYSKNKFQLLFQLFLIRLTEEFLNSYLENHSVSTSSISYEVVKLVSLNLTDPNLSVKSIAAEMHLNPDYIGRKFKTIMGISIWDFILKKRLQFAECQLIDTRDTVERIAEHCGFGSLRQFLRQFKKQEGITPSEFRRRQQMIHINVV